MRVRGGRSERERRRKEGREEEREGKKSVDERNFCPFVSNTFLTVFPPPPFMFTKLAVELAVPLFPPFRRSFN